MTHEEHQKHYDEITAHFHKDTLDSYKLQWAIFVALLELGPRGHEADLAAAQSASARSSRAKAGD